MEGNGANPGPVGRNHQVSPPDDRDGLIPVNPDEDVDAVDPMVQDAIASLRRVQLDTNRRAVDVAQRLVRKRARVA